jgi:2-amino-4-hydroxy-6-hydroxymethyldihydropteridine diphosphokinase
MNISYLLIGGNEGDRAANLAAARQHIAQTAGTLLQSSSVYETAPWGNPGQPDFYNQALKLETALDAPPLMKVLLEIEEKMGRRRLDKYGSRIIDIDILFFNDAIIREPGLSIPHPEIPNRRFVLAPMNEIAPTLRHPALRLSVEELLAACTDPLEVRRIHAPKGHFNK